MAYYNKRIIRHQQVTFDLNFVAPATAWIPPGMLNLLGIRGDIRHVKCRLDAGAAATPATADLYIADLASSDLLSTPKDEDVFYANVGATLNASATAASIADNPGASGGSLYEVAPIEGPDSNLGVGMQLTVTAAGDYLILVDVWAEVQL